MFDGLFYQGDVWCDGMYLGDTEGYFVPHQFEITSLVAERREHQLAVEVTGSPPGCLKAKRNLTGVFPHWDCYDPAWNPGGILPPARPVQSCCGREPRARVELPCAANARRSSS